MRTKSLLIAAAALTAGLLSAQAQNVYSINIVGYVNRPIQGNDQFTLVSNPLSSPTNTYEFLLKGALPAGWSVLKWNGSGFNSVSRVAFGTGWLPNTAGTNSFGPGEAVFIKAPPAAAAITNTFVGNVMVGSFTNNIGTGFSLIGNIIADGGAVTNLNFIPPTGTSLLKWKEDGIGGYTSFSKVTFGSGWLPSVPSVDVGQGFFVNAGTPFQWIRVFTNSP